MQTLIPELPPVLIAVVMEYFDNFGPDAPGCATWDCALSYQEFQDLIVPKLQPRRDDSDLFDGCSRAGCFYDVLQGQSAITGILGQLFSAGMSPHPNTIDRIAMNGGAFADWFANNFFMKITHIPTLFVDTQEQYFYDLVLANKHQQKFAKRKHALLQ